MAKKVRLWWALLAAWALNMQPAPHADGTDHRPTSSRIREGHDPDAESELPTRALAQPQGTEIGPVQPANRFEQFVAQPARDGYDEVGYWDVRRSMDATNRANTAAFALRSPRPLATPPAI